VKLQDRGDPGPLGAIDPLKKNICIILKVYDTKLTETFQGHFSPSQPPRNFKTNNNAFGK
jgi:hypothetical protein